MDAGEGSPEQDETWRCPLPGPSLSPAPPVRRSGLCNRCSKGQLPLYVALQLRPRLASCHPTRRPLRPRPLRPCLGVWRPRGAPASQRGCLARPQAPRPRGGGRAPSRVRLRIATLVARSCVCFDRSARLCAPSAGRPFPLPSAARASSHDDRGDVLVQRQGRIHGCAPRQQARHVVACKPLRRSARKGPRVASLARSEERRGRGGAEGESRAGWGQEGGGKREGRGEEEGRKEAVP